MRHRRYRVAVLGAQFVPQLLVDAERDYGAGFMEAGIIIVLRHLVQSQGHVVPRTDPFTRIDCARFQGGRDLACRKIDDDAAEPSQDLPAQPRHAVTQATVAFRPRDLLREPAAHLPAAVRRHQWLDVVSAAQFVPQLLPAVETNPGSHFVSGQAEWHRGEEIETREVLLPGNIAAMIHSGYAATDDL